MQSALSTPECGPTTTSDTFVSTVHRTSFKFYQNKPNFSNISELKQKASAWNYLNMTQSYLFIYLTSKNFCGRILVYNGVKIQNTLDAFSMSESQTGQKQFSIKNIHLQQLIFKSIYNKSIYNITWWETMDLNCLSGSKEFKFNALCRLFTPYKVHCKKMTLYLINNNLTMNSTPTCDSGQF